MPAVANSSADVRDITDRSSNAYPMPGGASAKSWTTRQTPSARAHEIDGVRGQPASGVPRRMCRPDRRQPVAVARVEQVGGHDPVTHELSRAVEVAQQFLERLHPLDHGRRQPLERLGVDHDRDRVEPPRTTGDRRRPPVGTYGQVVHEVSRALGDE